MPNNNSFSFRVIASKDFEEKFLFFYTNRKHKVQNNVLKFDTYSTNTLMTC